MPFTTSSHYNTSSTQNSFSTTIAHLTPSTPITHPSLCKNTALTLPSSFSHAQSKETCYGFSTRNVSVHILQVHTRILLHYKLHFTRSHFHSTNSLTHCSPCHSPHSTQPQTHLANFYNRFTSLSTLVYIFESNFILLQSI